MIIYFITFDKTTTISQVLELLGYSYVFFNLVRTGNVYQLIQERFL